MLYAKNFNDCLDSDTPSTRCKSLGFGNIEGNQVHEMMLSNEPMDDNAL